MKQQLQKQKKNKKIKRNKKIFNVQSLNREYFCISRFKSYSDIIHKQYLRYRQEHR